MSWACTGRPGCDNCTILFQKLEELTSKIQQIQKDRTELVSHIKYQNKILHSIAKKQKSQDINEMNNNSVPKSKQFDFSHTYTPKQRIESPPKLTSKRQKEKIVEKVEVDNFVRKVENLVIQIEQSEIKDLKMQLDNERNKNDELYKQIAIYASKQKERQIRELELKNQNLQQKMDNLTLELIDVKISNKQYQDQLGMLNQTSKEQDEYIEQQQQQVQDFAINDQNQQQIVSQKSIEFDHIVINQTDPDASFGQFEEEVEGEKQEPIQLQSTMQVQDYQNKELNDQENKSNLQQSQDN